MHEPQDVTGQSHLTTGLLHHARTMRSEVSLQSWGLSRGHTDTLSKCSSKLAPRKEIGSRFRQVRSLIAVERYLGLGVNSPVKRV